MFVERIWQEKSQSPRKIPPPNPKKPQQNVFVLFAVKAQITLTA
jgi:hypothetical protein